jgi:hypothetical protein
VIDDDDLGLGHVTQHSRVGQGLVVQESQLQAFR